MEIAIGMVAAALALLGLILAYIWRANGRYLKLLMDGQRELMVGQQRLQEGQATTARELMEGQKEIARGIGEVAKITQEILREVRAKE